MTSHAPKTGALIAYEGGLLSAKGRARVERHLAGCDVCQRELAVIRLYDEQADAIREAPAPALDWSKMELALEREASVQAKKHRRQWMLPAAGVVLAAAAAVLLALEPPPSAPPTTGLASVVPQPTPMPIAPAPASSSYDAFVTLVAGASEVRAESGTSTAALGHRIAAGDTLATSDTGSLHFALGTAPADATAPADGPHSVLAAALDPGTSLRMVALDGAEAPQLALDQGRVTVHMREARTIILAGQYRIEAEVASFVVDLDEADGDVAIDVREGEVRVTGPATDTTLRGPSRFPSGTAALGDVEPMGLADDYASMPTLRIARPGIVRWQLGDTVAQGAGEIAMRVGVGRIAVTAWDARGRAYHTNADVTADGLDLAPDELTPEAPRVRVGFLPESDIMNVVQHHGRRLRSCYERALHVDETLSVSVRADVTIEITGTVETVRFRGEMPPVMDECVTHEIQSWSFPAPEGGPVTFTLPVVFAPPT